MGFNGTGPFGRGPRTGRGFGNCDLPERSTVPYPPYRPGFGFFQRLNLG
ncbi:MAG: DUF5320 domain-containing protein [Dethiobacteria bacterium]